MDRAPSRGGREGGGPRSGGPTVARRAICGTRGPSAELASSMSRRDGLYRRFGPANQPAGTIPSRRPCPPPNSHERLFLGAGNSCARTDSRRRPPGGHLCLSPPGPVSAARPAATITAPAPTLPAISQPSSDCRSLLIVSLISFPQYSVGRYQIGGDDLHSTLSTRAAARDQDST